MSAYISDGLGAGQQMHIICDGCHAEAVFPPSRADIDVSETPIELVGWRHGIGLRDLCPECLARPDAASPRP